MNNSQSRNVLSLNSSGGAVEGAPFSQRMAPALASPSWGYFYDRLFARGGKRRRFYSESAITFSISSANFLK